jgi:hypothetical protein
MVVNGGTSIVAGMSDDEIDAAIGHLEAYGYCILRGRLRPEVAAAMAESFLTLHTSENAEFMHGAGEDYQTLFGMLNRDDRTWECAAHPDVQRVVQHFLGHSYRVVDCCSKPSWPGSPAQTLHVDSASGMQPILPVECPHLINGIWMLSDFTVENGCTRIVPISHRSRVSSPPFQESELIQPVEGKAGDMILWHGGAFHQAGPNTSTGSVRVGLNLGYCATWYNNWVEGGHQPLWPETYARMPEEMQALCTGIHATTNAATHEFIAVPRPPNGPATPGAVTHP